MTGKKSLYYASREFHEGGGWEGGVVRIKKYIAGSQIDNRFGGGNKLSFGILEVR